MNEGFVYFIKADDGSNQKWIPITLVKQSMKNILCRSNMELKYIKQNHE